MNGGVRVSVAGVMLGLLALAGCGRGFFQGGEREPWRHEAEAACMKSGAVKLGAGVVQIEPIQGPGICGADFPLKVSALGAPPVMSYADPVPPGSIPNGSRMPPFPPTEQRYLPPARDRGRARPARANALDDRSAARGAPAVIGRADATRSAGRRAATALRAAAASLSATALRPPPQAYPQQRYAAARLSQAHPPQRYAPHRRKPIRDACRAGGTAAVARVARRHPARCGNSPRRQRRGATAELAAKLSAAARSAQL